MDWKSIVGRSDERQYERRIKELQARGISTTSIEETVLKTVENLSHDQRRSFVIFGEPQSGKTEMMIALNAKLLDDGYPLIINLLTDSIDLLGQSLDRFRLSGLDPSPKQFNELPKEASDIRDKRWVIFSKKNARDLEKLLTTLRLVEKVIVIDDEADFASPDAKVNKEEKTKINKLIHDLLGEHGSYIGVTATPARLNLNNTFDNTAEQWVDFKPHSAYVGQDFFFPTDGKVDYKLHTFQLDEGDERGELQNAILHFMCGVAEQHFKSNTKNFTMLVHTSGKKNEHAEDVLVIQNTIRDLSNPKSKSFDRLTKKLEKIALE